MKKLVAVLLTFLFLLVGCSKPEVTKIENKDEKTDSIRFYNEYKTVDKNNLYDYETYESIKEAITKKTGIIYLGFPGCDLCKEIVPILDSVAKENNISKIYYYDFENIRDDNTEEYQELVNLLSEFLISDEEGNKRITAPLILFVKNGKINSVYKGVLNNEQEEILTEEQKISLRKELKDLIIKIILEDD